MTEDAHIHPMIHDALNLDGDPENIKRYYEKWAADYDRDVAEEQYAGPRVTVDLLLATLTKRGAVDINLEIVDVGCGTGLVGRLLHEAGFRQIDGLDLSPAMVSEAEKLGVYRLLQGDVDMTQPLNPLWRAAYDVVLCCGMFTLGHVPPETLRPLFHMCRAGGLVIVSTRTGYYDTSDYQAVSDSFVTAGAVKLLAVLRDAPYTSDGDSHYWVYELILT